MMLRHRATGADRPYKTTGAPNEPFGARRNQLAVLAEIAAIRCEENDGAVERPAGPFDDSDNKMDVVGLSDCPDAIAQAERLRRERRRADQHVARPLPGFLHTIDEFLGVPAVSACDPHT